MSTFLLVVFSITAIASALTMITRSNPVNAGVSLLGVFVSLAAMYIVLNAQFIAAIQITIYAGAILVLVLFVIMLLNLKDPGRSFKDLITGSRQGLAVIAVMAVFAVELYVILVKTPFTPASVSGPYTDKVIAGEGAIQSLSSVLFSNYILPFEVASVLLLIAIIGAVALTRRPRKDGEGAEK